MSSGYLFYAFYHVCEIAERSPHAYKLVVRLELFKPLDLLELIAHIRFDHLRLLERRGVVVEQRRQIHSAYRKVDAVQYRAAVVLYELYRRAGNIHNDAFGYFERVDYAVIYLRRFLLLGQHVHFKPTNGIDFFQKTSLIFRLTHGVGGKCVYLVHAVSVAQFCGTSLTSAPPALFAPVLNIRRVPYPAQAARILFVRRKQQSNCRLLHAPIPAERS